jgi:thiamine-phosphate pyrophosphorylase
MGRREERIERLRRSRLYAITSSNHPDPQDLLGRCEAVLRGGADLLQLRLKGAGDDLLLDLAGRLRDLTARYGALLILNDRPDLAARVDADGAHVGQDDLPVQETRRVLGEGRLVGVSTHSVEQARRAVEDGADYIGVGPVFPTPTKAGRAAVTLDYVRAVSQMRLDLPAFAIGGIDLDRLPEVMRAGARRVAVVRALLDANDPEKAARDFQKALETTF